MSVKKIVEFEGLGPDGKTVLKIIATDNCFSISRHVEARYNDFEYHVFPIGGESPQDLWQLLPLLPTPSEASRDRRFYAHFLSCKADEDTQRALMTERLKFWAIGNCNGGYYRPDTPMIAVSEIEALSAAFLEAEEAIAAAKAAS